MKTKMISVFVILVAVAALFVGRTVVAPPFAQAAISQGINPDQMTAQASKGLASFDDRYQAHIGVLDTLRP